MPSFTCGKDCKHYIRKFSNIKIHYMRHYRRPRARAGRAVGFLAFIIAGALVFGGLVMLLWNNLMPDLFHLPLITFWQALGLLVLAKILFSGFRGGGPFQGRWRHKVQQRWMEMTPEERERFKQEWGGRCGHRFGERQSQPESGKEPSAS